MASWLGYGKNGSWLAVGLPTATTVTVIPAYFVADHHCRSVPSTSFYEADSYDSYSIPTYFVTDHHFMKPLGGSAQSSWTSIYLIWTRRSFLEGVNKVQFGRLTSWEN